MNSGPCATRTQPGAVTTLRKSSGTSGPHSRLPGASTCACLHAASAPMPRIGRRLDADEKPYSCLVADSRLPPVEACRRTDARSLRSAASHAGGRDRGKTRFDDLGRRSRERPLLGLDAAAAPARLVAGGEDGSEVRRPERPRLPPASISIDGHRVRRLVVELGRLQRRVPRDLLGVCSSRPPVRQIRRDPPVRRKQVEREEARRGRRRLDHGQHNPPRQRPPRSLFPPPRSTL